MQIIEGPAYMWAAKIKSVEFVLFGDYHEPLEESRLKKKNEVGFTCFSGLSATRHERYESDGEPEPGVVQAQSVAVDEYLVRLLKLHRQKIVYFFIEAAPSYRNQRQEFPGHFHRTKKRFLHCFTDSATRAVAHKRDRPTLRQRPSDYEKMCQKRYFGNPESRFFNADYRNGEGNVFPSANPGGDPEDYRRVFADLLERLFTFEFPARESYLPDYYAKIFEDLELYNAFVDDDSLQEQVQATLVPPHWADDKDEVAELYVEVQSHFRSADLERLNRVKPTLPLMQKQAADPAVEAHFLKDTGVLQFKRTTREMREDAMHLIHKIGHQLQLVSKKAKRKLHSLLIKNVRSGGYEVNLLARYNKLNGAAFLGKTFRPTDNYSAPDFSLNVYNHLVNDLWAILRIVVLIEKGVPAVVTGYWGVSHAYFIKTVLTQMYKCRSREVFSDDRCIRL
jgi:hypothetical protein